MKLGLTISVMDCKNIFCFKKYIDLYWLLFWLYGGVIEVKVIKMKQSKKKSRSLIQRPEKLVMILGILMKR